MAETLGDTGGESAEMWCSGGGIICGDKEVV